MATTFPTKYFALSCLFVRKCIGVTGMALPFVLAFGNMLLGHPGILDSISAYYYSPMRDIFVSSLCAIGVFLICYRYDRIDNVLSSLAGVCAIGIALFPIAPPRGATEQQGIIAWFHYGFAVCFFLLMAYFTLVLFRRTTTEKPPTQRKQQRNTVYLLSGIIIVTCLVLIVLVQTLLASIPWLQSLHPVFWLETLAIEAFSIAWFVKGDTILRDEYRVTVGQSIA